MEILHKISPQKISWVKSNYEAFEKSGAIIENLYYPENVNELLELVRSFQTNNIPYSIIGYSSNTLFLPTFSATHVICTKKVNSWIETDDEIICDCGVNVSLLSKQMVKKGFVGFEGLTDLPGTLAAGIYGNCGCRGCTICGIVRHFTMLLPTGEVKEFSIDDLDLQYRSTALKRGTLNGVIIKIALRKIQGNAEKLKDIARKNHETRTNQQPSAANNLGTTIVGGSQLTFKGKLLIKLEQKISWLINENDRRKTFPILLKAIGKGKFAPYVYYWNRYMFLDAKSHIFFDEYMRFIKTIYKDASLEIEIKK